MKPKPESDGVISISMFRPGHDNVVWPLVKRSPVPYSIVPHSAAKNEEKTEWNWTIVENRNCGIGSVYNTLQ